MLKNIPFIISPDLMYVMMCMGHGDELVLADGDFPADTFSKRVIRADGLRIADLLKAILSFFPLDTFVDKPAGIMAPVGKGAKEPESWKEFRDIISKFDKRFIDFDYIERYEFYKRAEDSFAVVVTSEPDGNIILRKGVVAV